MTHRHAVVVVCLAVALLASPTILAQETATATRNATNESDGTAGMGAQLTAFTQSNAAAAGDSVENGMWRAGFDQSNASERARLVRDRAGTLERRLERLQRENRTLRRAYENGSVPEPAYVARQSRLGARIDALQTAINDTGEAAERAGVDQSRLDRLRENASALSGPQVAGVARGLGGGPPANRGPPDDRGNGAAAENRGPPANHSASEAPADAAGNRTDAVRGGPAGRQAGDGSSGPNTDGSTGGADGGARSGQAAGTPGS